MHFTGTKSVILKLLIDLALDSISTCDANIKFIIVSDSLSVLKAMNHTSSKESTDSGTFRKMS